ncbi:hypothetical protein Dimus_038663 [Dionaea muscipula]
MYVATCVGNSFSNQRSDGGIAANCSAVSGTIDAGASFPSPPPSRPRPCPRSRRLPPHSIPPRPTPSCPYLRRRCSGPHPRPTPSPITSPSSATAPKSSPKSISTLSPPTS